MPRLANGISVERVKSFDDPKTEQALVVLKAAFEDSIILFDGHQELFDMFCEMDLRAIISGGSLIVAVDEERNKVVGIAGWYPPGSEYLADEEQRKEAKLDEFFAALGEANPASLKWWKEVFLPATANQANKYLGANAKLDNWTVYSLGVLAEFRNRGIATQLLKYAEDKAAKEGHFVCCEASDEVNVTIYKKLGYTVAGSDTLEGPPGIPSFTEYVLVKYP
ncbi:hypothetical protein C8J56DRAFT_1160132 [Mycena floridula]|nr:hypothetical protein C8J56DRAFT_1160132 [Mycena floridula]